MWCVHLNLGMCFPNRCGVELNLRRMDQLVAMIILPGKPGSPSARVAIWNSGKGKRHDRVVDASVIDGDRLSATGGSFADPRETAAQGAQRSDRSARCIRNWQARCDQLVARSPAICNRRSGTATVVGKWRQRHGWVTARNHTLDAMMKLRDW